MSPQLQEAILAARALSSRDKLELLQVIASDLQLTEALDEANTAFWSAPSLDEIVRTGSAPVVTDVHTLVGDFWPEDESADDFNRFVAERRQLDRLSQV